MKENRQQENLDSRVRAVWRRGQMLHAAAGMLAFCRWAVLLFLAGMVVDWMTYMPTSGRVVIFVTLLAAAAYKAWRCGWRQVRAFNATHTALRIEEHVGGLESLLVSAVQFQNSGLCTGTSESLRDATCRRAEESVEPLRPEEIVRYHGLRRPLAGVLILALIVGVFAVVNGPFLAVGVARIFPPWSAISYPTRTQLGLKSGDMIVKEGDEARIEARVSGVIPSRAKLALRTGTARLNAGGPRMHSLEITKGVCQYTVESAFRGFEYRILAGDARSPWHTVEVISSPRIERAKVSLEFPPYTDRPTETVEALTVTVPEGTRIKWQLTLDRALSKAEFNPAGGETRPLDVSQDGRAVTMQQVATQSRAYSFSWVDKEHGFSFTGPSHYVQVAPDQSPHVEITSPKDNLYATLGRKLDLAFRGRDDHGIGESVVAYRVNKTEEEKVPFAAQSLSAQALSDGGEQRIDWDYRTVLPELAVGDTVSFVVELTDRYPGPNGPHRVRSMARRVSFLSREDYLEHIAKQKRRLLSRLRAVYREERSVYEVVRRLDPSDVVFIQTCQLEAVRQDLMRERLAVLAERMRDLLEDLAANNVTDEAETATLAGLSSDLQTVAEEHVGRAASQLRELAVVSNRTASADVPDPGPAVHMVDSAARELGCLVLQIGFKEATEVMARELHAIAETQAHLRLQTIMTAEAASDETEGLAVAQGNLAQWLIRLFGATPRDKESTVEDALVAFNLSRLIKELRGVGVDSKMLESVVLIRSGGSDEAVRLQADVIRALLKAEFRLRVGSEHEALFKAGELFKSQAAGQKKLREASVALTPEEFNKRRAEFGQAQAALHMKLHLLLMPATAAPRPRLFDIELPPKPPVDDLLAAAEGAMEKAVAFIDAGDRDQAAIEQQQAETSFEALTGIVRRRIEALAERERTAGLIGACGKHLTEIGLFEERQLSLLEKTEDAADDGSNCALVAQLEQKLIEDVEKFRTELVEWNEGMATPSKDVLPLLGWLDRTVGSMAGGVSFLEENQPDQAIAHQETALDALAEAVGLIGRQTTNHSALKATLDDRWIALTPAPYVADIQAEQRDLVVATEKAKEADLPHLAIVQKNLIHAVGAVLNSLEVLSHRIEAGTAMLFAKDDMNEAAIAIRANDLVEAADAQTFVAESLGDLLAELQTVTPQYGYILEVTEVFHEIVSEGMIIHAEQSQIREKLPAAPDDASLGKLIDRQRALQLRAKAYGKQLHKVTGLKSYSASAGYMSAALSQLQAGDRDAALEQMKLVDDTLTADTKTLLNLTELLSNVLKPPPGPEVSPEATLVLNALALASHQKVLYRKTQTASPKQAAGLAAEQIELADRCELLAASTESYSKVHMSNAASRLKAEYARMSAANRDALPLSEANDSQQERLEHFFANSRAKVIEANKLMLEAAWKLKDGSTKVAISSQHRSGELLRHFLIECMDEFLVVPGPPAASDPAITDPIESLSDEMMMFMPGAVSGGRPKGGRLEWEVLGRRERAALNENFARELPLEYRAILKDYYERLAQ